VKTLVASATASWRPPRSTCSILFSIGRKEVDLARLQHGSYGPRVRDGAATNRYSPAVARAIRCIVRQHLSSS
jgi:hypothetical protein